MSQNSARKLVAIFVCLILFSGCSKKEEVILVPYREQLKNFSYSSNLVLYRESGIAGEICVIQDESVYDEDEIAAEAAALFNITQHETLYSKNAFKQLPMASLTKLMTALLALEYGELDKEVVLTQDVVITTYDAWLCGFQPGDHVSLRDLLYATLIYSGNDAANAVAAAISDGSMKEFVNQMNERAHELGVSDTHFANPNGLDASNHYSSVYDIYLIFNECLKYPEFKKIIPMASFTCTYQNALGEEITKKFNSGNAYLNKTAVPENKNITIYGGKTGHTEKAGYCLVTFAKDQKGDEYVAVILGAETKQQAYAQTNLLLQKIQ